MSWGLLPSLSHSLSLPLRLCHRSAVGFLYEDDFSYFQGSRKEEDSSSTWLLISILLDCNDFNSTDYYGEIQLKALHWLFLIAIVLISMTISPFISNVIEWCIWLNDYSCLLIKLMYVYLYVICSNKLYFFNLTYV